MSIEHSTPFQRKRLRRIHIEEQLATKIAAAFKANSGVNDLYGPLSYAIEIKRPSGRDVGLTPVEQLGPRRYRCHIFSSETGIVQYFKDAIVQVG